MGETNKKYPVKEIAIFLRGKSVLDGKERCQVGDIIEVRYPSIGIGKKEAKEYLWLRVEGLEELEFDRLKDPLGEPFSKSGDYKRRDGSVKYDKRRFSIPLHILKRHLPNLNIDKALDLNTIYQPFFILDEDDQYTTDFLFLADKPPLQAQGLIFDKNTNTFI